MLTCPLAHTLRTHERCEQVGLLTIAMAPSPQGCNNEAILRNIVWATHADVHGEWSKDLETILSWTLMLKPDARPSGAPVAPE